MEFEIWQIGEENPEAARQMFQGLGKEKLNLSWYKKVCTSQLQRKDCNDTDISEILWAVFQKYNLDIPKDFRGHSLSVSDIVVIGSHIYYCQPLGWKRLKSSDITGNLLPKGNQ